jgi:hypothetical protein
MAAPSNCVNAAEGEDVSPRSPDCLAGAPPFERFPGLARLERVKGIEPSS